MRCAVLTSLVLAGVMVAYCLAQVDDGNEAGARADATAKLAKAELDKALESNRKTPGAVAASEIERLTARYRKLMLAQIGRGEVARRSYAQSKASQAEYEQVLDANRKVPGAVVQQSVDDVHNAYQDDAIKSLQDQVVELQDEVAKSRKELSELRKQVAELRKKR